MEWLIGASVLTTLGALGTVVLVASLLLPVAWLWMLVDAMLRQEWEYPGGSATSQNRLLWVLLILFVHCSAVFYFFLVYRAVPRGSRPQPFVAASA